MCPQLAQLLREPTPAPVGRAMGQDWGVPGPSLWAWEMLMWREAAHPGAGSFQAQSLPPGPGFCAQTTAWRVEHGQACVRSNVSDALSLIIDFIPKRQGADSSVSTFEKGCDSGPVPGECVSLRDDEAWCVCPSVVAAVRVGRRATSWREGCSSGTKVCGGWRWPT